SLWSTAPFLLNNSVGPFYGEPSVDARMASFNASIQQMLWPEERVKDIDEITKLELPKSLAVDVPGYIQRTTADSYLTIAWGYLPSWGYLLAMVKPWLFGKNGLEIGPIPKGTPVGMLGNLPLVPESRRLKDQIAYAFNMLRLLNAAAVDLKAVKKAPQDKKREAFANLVDPLLRLSKCPDYVVNRGHYFGTNLSNEDKWALIEFLKTF